MKKRSYVKEKIVVAGIIILFLILLLNLFNTIELNSEINNRLAEIKEAERPARLELIDIKTDCINCFDITEVIDTLKTSDINITNELTIDSNSEEAKIFIEQYNIKKLPAVILKGEINKTSIQSFKEQNDALIFDNADPPYVDAETGKIIGSVSAIIITDKSCSVCDDFGAMIQSLKQNNIVFSEIKNIDFNSSEATEFITKYEIKKLPSLFLSDDVDVYPVIQNLRQAGFQLNKDYYILQSSAPYVESDTGNIRGLVTLTMITDKSCQDCYDVNIHKIILTRLGLAINDENITDINSSEGKGLIEKYNITKVPTILLNGDVGVYDSFNIIWPQIGTIEDDGMYVFRKLDALGKDIKYRNLANSTGM